MPNYLITIIVSSIGGVLLGWLAALAIKSAARTLGCLVVVVFIAIQILGYYNLMQWNWLEFFESMHPLFGVAKDALKSGVSAATCNLPLSVGFLIGLLLGIRR